MITRRHALKLSLGSFVAALPVGTRAVAALPAAVDAPPVEVVTVRPCRMKAWLFVSDRDGMSESYGVIEVHVPSDGSPATLTIGDMDGFAVPTR